MRATEFITEDIEDLIRFHTNRLTNDPKFQQWFKGSKVTNKDGSPLVCYHGTDTTFGENFRPFSHFGTMTAAHSILNIKGNKNPQVRLVFLSIKNPELIMDDENIEHNSMVFLMLHTFNISLWSELNEFLPPRKGKTHRHRFKDSLFLEKENLILDLLDNRNDKDDGFVKSYKRVLDLLIEFNKEPGSFTIDEFLKLYSASNQVRTRAILKKMKESNVDGFYYENECCKLVRSLEFGPATTHDPTSMYRPPFHKTIRAGVPIGDPVVGGAHRLVRQEVPSFSLVVGSPATVIGAVGLSDDHDVWFASF